MIGEFSSFCQSELNNYETVIVISHSLGAVIVNGMLIAHEESNVESKKYISHLMITPAFFGGAFWAGVSLSKTAKQLKKNSAFLKDMNDKWKKSHVKKSID